MENKKRTIYILIITVGLSIVTWIFSIVFIKNLGLLLYSLGDVQFGAIFSQLQKSSSIIPSIIFPLLINGLTMFLFFRKDINKLVLKVVLMVFVAIIAQIISISLALVNGIYFIDIIISLINNIGGLGL